MGDACVGTEVEVEGAEVEGGGTEVEVEGAEVEGGGTEVEVEGAEVEGGGTEREEVVVIREQEVPGRSAGQPTCRGWINVVV